MALTPQLQDLVNKVRQELSKNGITPEMQAAFKMKNPHVFGKSAEPSISVSEPKPVDFAKFADSERAKLQTKIEQLKKDPKYSALLKTPMDAAALEKALSAGAPVVSGAAITAAVARPYRLKIGDQVQSFQVVDGKWKQIDSDHWVKTRQAKAVRDAPMYLVATLNATKKKVDAQRAAGNLTDSRRFKGNVVS